MRARGILRTGIILAVCMFSFCGMALGAVVNVGTYAFENDGEMLIPKFDLNLGRLESITYSISGFSFSGALICDVDDAFGSYENQISFQRDFGVFRWKAIDANPFPFYMSDYIADAVRIYNVINVNIQGVEDGDGKGYYNGGPDEQTVNITHSGLEGSSKTNDPETLTFQSGEGFCELFIYKFFCKFWPFLGNRVIECYTETTHYGGFLTVEYEYSPVPLPSALWILGSGVIGVFGYVGISRRKRFGSRA